jgi:anti-sigma factor RsiW
MMTTRQALESLLIDRTVKELPPEVETLLNAYLAQDPGAAQDARQVEEAITLAKEAVAIPQPQSLPAPRFVQRQRFALALPHWKELLHPIQLATGLAAGLVLGWWIATAQWQVAPSPATKMISSSDHAVTAHKTSMVSTPDFRTSLAAQYRKPVAPTRNIYSVVWDSRESKPRIKNNL